MVIVILVTYVKFRTVQCLFVKCGHLVALHLDVVWPFVFFFLLRSLHSCDYVTIS